MEKGVPIFPFAGFQRWCYQYSYNRNTFLLHVWAPEGAAILGRSLSMKSRKGFAWGIMYTETPHMPDMLIAWQTWLREQCLWPCFRNIQASIFNWLDPILTEKLMWVPFCISFLLIEPMALLCFGLPWQRFHQRTTNMEAVWFTVMNGMFYICHSVAPRLQNCRNPTKYIYWLHKWKASSPVHLQKMRTGRIFHQPARLFVCLFFCTVTFIVGQLLIAWPINAIVLRKAAIFHRWLEGA